MARTVSTLLNFKRYVISRLTGVKYYSCDGSSSELTGLILGVYNEDADPSGQVKTFTKTAEKFDKKTEGRLTELIKQSGAVPKKGEVRTFYGVDKRFTAVAVVGLGDECVSYNEVEQMDEWKEGIRQGAATASKSLQNLNMTTVYTDGLGHAESAAEGCCMGVWLFQEFKDPAKQKKVPRLLLFDDCDFTGWQIGLHKGAAQNLARQLCETPANLLTPSAFAQVAISVLCTAGVSVEVKLRNWSKMNKMDAFLASAKGSCEPPVFLETSYYGCEPDISPVVLIGKGLTFNSGGLCLKEKEELKHMRGDMVGAACIVAVCRAVSALQLPINIRGLVPLWENLPGTCSMKPGDIVRSKNGKTILVEGPEYDGRLALADAFTYASSFNPKFILDVGSLRKETGGALGSAATGVFCNNDLLYEQMKIASIHTGDRVWRMPLWDHFTEKLTTTSEADLADRNVDIGQPCTAAAFLREFVPGCDWIHLDTYGVMRSDGTTVPYLSKGMTGRPTRTIIEFLAQLACKHAIPTAK